MDKTDQTIVRERIFAGFLTLLGLYAFAHSIVVAGRSKVAASEIILAILFCGAIILADRFPIHLARGTKASLVNLPIFLSAVLLPAPLVVLATGAGLLVADYLARIERGLLARDFLSTAGQWMFTSFVGYQIVHLSLPGVSGSGANYGLLLLCAFFFLFMDAVIFSLSQSFVFGEAFIVTLKSVIREGSSLEIIQYLTAILGALAADQDLGSLILLVVPISITYVAFKNIKEMRHETVRILEDMADTVDLRDIYTGGHSKRVAELVAQTLFRLKISGPEATLIEIAARLHDIGKIGIPDGILMKPGRLSNDETALMRTHSQKGADLISKYKDFARGASIIRHHHERWDGNGYPARLKGAEIPFGARVIAVADSFDAMTSDRPYRKALSHKHAIQTLLEGRGNQWDPNVVNAFVDMIGDPLDVKFDIRCTEQAVAAERLQTSPISSR